MNFLENFKSSLNKKRLITYWKRAKNFSENYKWVVQDGFANQKLNLAIITGVSCIGAFCQGSVIILLATFVKVVESDTRTNIAILDDIFANRLLSISLLCICFFSLLILTAISNHYVAIKCRKLARAYNEKCAAFVLESFGKVQRIDQEFRYTNTNITCLINRDARLMSKTIEMLILSIQPLGRMVAALCILLYFDIKLSLLLAPFFVIFFFPFIYKLSDNTHKTMEQFYDNVIIDMRKQLQNLIRLTSNNNIYQTNKGYSLAQAYLKTKEIKEFYDIYDDVKLITYKAAFATSIFKSFLSVFVLFVLGYYVVYTKTPWGNILVYMTALLLFINSIQGLVQKFASLNLFYPAIKEYVKFYNYVQRFTLTKNEKVAVVDKLNITSSDVLDGGKKSIILKLGDRVLYVTPHKLDRITFASLIAPLVEASSLNLSKWQENVCFISSIQEYFPGTLYKNITNNTDSKDLDYILQSFEKLGIKNEFNKLPNGFDTYIVQEAWANLSDKFKITIKVLALQHVEKKIIFFPHNLLAKISREFVDQLLDLLSDKIVILTLNKPIKKPFAKLAFVTIDQKIAGIGDVKWLNNIEFESDTKTNDEDEDEELLLEL